MNPSPGIGLRLAKNGGAEDLKKECQHVAQVERPKKESSRYLANIAGKQRPYGELGRQ